MTSIPTLLNDGGDYNTDDYNAYDEQDYNYTEHEPYIPSVPPPHSCISQARCVILVALYSIIFLLGLLGNGVVIWVVAFKMPKRTVNTTWYLSLALSDFLYCATLPFNITLTATEAWIFGAFMCKFASFVLFLNMFGSIFLMVVISADRCVAVVCAVWAQNHRRPGKAAVAVFVAWLVSALLSAPSLVTRDVTYDNSTQVSKCHNNYSLLLIHESATVVPVVRFVLGFVFPLAVIGGCYTVIIVKLQSNKLAKSSTKPLRIMTALVVTFVISWLPYHIFILLEIKLGHDIPIGTTAAVILASANSCMNPFLYTFMGKDVKRKLLSSFVPNIERAFMEERSSGTRSTSMSQAYNSSRV